MPKSDEFCAGQPDEAILVNQTGCRNNYGDPLICDIGGLATLTGIIAAIILSRQFKTLKRF